MYFNHIKCDIFPPTRILFWNVRAETLSLNCSADSTVEETSRGKKKKKKKAKKKTAYLTGLRVGFGQSFPTVPTRRSSGGVDGESNSPVINTRVKSRLLIIFYFQCVWEVCRPAAGSLHEAASPIEATASTLFFSLLVFFIRDFFFFFYFHSARWAGSEEWRRRELECLCLLGDRLVNHMNIQACL